MRKDQVYIGMIVEYEDKESLVFKKYDDSVHVTILSTGDIIECNYSELKTIDAWKIKSYNRDIREINSKYNGRFSKNEDKIFDFVDGSNIWFTSDTHFCHDNIIKFCNRPYNDIKEMNQSLVNNWNTCVKPDDIVFHLGDFCWGGSDNWNYILNNLNGHIHLILGNHDIKNIRQGYMKYFDSVSFQRQITIEGRKIYLNHYPFLTWGGIYRNPKEIVWQLFGHVHSKDTVTGGADESRLNYLLPYQYDVGVDRNNYRPISYYEVRDIIENQIDSI